MLLSLELLYKESIANYKSILLRKKFVKFLEYILLNLLIS